MSHYPTSPYTTPNMYPGGYGYDPMAGYLAPAKRAGMLLIVLGLLMGVYSVCNAAGVLLVPPDQWIAQNQRMGMESELPIETVKTMGVIFSIVAGILGMVMISLGLFVRRGSVAAHIIAIVLDSIVVLVLGLIMLVTLVAAMQSPLFLLVTAFVVIVLVLFVLQLIWLIQGVRASSRAGSMRTQYQMQYWQYMQQQQMYMQQAGHGYAQAPQQAPPQPDASKG